MTAGSSLFASADKDNRGDAQDFTGFHAVDMTAPGGGSLKPLEIDEFYSSNGIFQP